MIRRIPVGGEGRWDYLTVDPAARRLYLSRSTHVMVLDVDSGKVVGDLPDTQGVHGIAIVAELGRGFISNGGANTVTIFDLKTLVPIAQVKTGENPDAILYDPASKRVFAFNGGSGDATAIDAATGTVAGTIALGGKPEAGAADGKVITTLAIGEGVDGNGFDAASGLAFSTNGDGTLTVVHEESPAEFAVIANVETRRGARTMTIDAKTHHVFVVTADFLAPAAGTPNQPRERPQMKPDSFVVLELGQ